MTSPDKPALKSISQLMLHNRFADLGSAFSSPVTPSAFDDFKLVSLSASAAALIDLDAQSTTEPEFTEYLTGQLPWPQSKPLAQVYSGHQFGQWAGQLGDGRALLLGEVENQAGEYWDIQIKGAGPTPYSRGADGRAVLRSSIREYLCSEAMHGLGIPTTRALALFASDAPIYREEVETAALVVRMAPSHIRFGSFEHFYHGGKHEELKQLIDFTIENYYPECLDADKPVLAFIEAVVVRTAKMIAQWQAVGFCHGVMNTDNMSVLGLTLDYGPFGFMDAWDAGHVCNHSDHQGRYAFNQQPQIGQWNLIAWISCFLPWVEEDDARAAIAKYSPLLNAEYENFLHKKLGLETTEEGDEQLIADLFKLLQENHPDHTNFYRALSHLPQNADSLERTAITDLFIDRDGIRQWLDDYQQRLQKESSDDAQRHIRMQGINPKYILRNYLAQQAIDKAQQKDYSEIDKLLTLLSQPFAEQPEMQAYAKPAPDWASGLEVSCSS